MRRFAIYYNNGDVVRGGDDSDEEVTLTFSKKWLEAPSDGVACVVYEDKRVGRQILGSNEYFYQMPIDHHGKGALGASMKIGAYLRQLSDLGGIVKFGGWTDDVNFQEIKNKANKDEVIPYTPNKVEPHSEDEAD